MKLGIDYYPEHWPDHMLEEDLARIKNMGANTIRIGEFAWHLIEPKQGTFDFSYFDRVIEKAKATGLGLVYGTPTATFPAWLAKAYPQVLSVDDQGQTRVFGGRRQYCYNSKDYLDLSLKMVEKLVSHYAHEEAIFMWQVDNEFGHEGSDDCYCPQCHTGFHKFLEDKYTSLDHLNQVYGTIFWGQTYNSFDEIPMPTKTITTHNPVLKLDWMRFRSQSINQFALKHIAMIKRHMGSHQRVTHNFFGGYFDRKYDQNVMSEALDVVAFDNYPVWGGLMEPLSPAEVAMGHDYMRGLKQQNFWVMEQLIGAQGHDDIGYLPRDGQSSLWAAQALAKGCDALVYFRYRGFHKGAEQFCQGILDANNLDNDKSREVSRFFDFASRNADLWADKITSNVALLYKYDNRWSWHGQRQSEAFDFTKEALRVYEPFHELNVQVDVISTEKDFSTYKLVLVPAMQVMSLDLINRLKDFVEKGGQVVFGYRASIKDENNNIVFGQVAPCYLSDLVGARVHNYESLGKDIWAPTLSQKGQAGSARVWRDLLVTTSATSLIQYDDEYKAYSALTVNAYGRGKAYYMACGLDHEALISLAKSITEDLAITCIPSQKNLEVVKRGGQYVLLNHNAHRVTWGSHDLEAYEVKVTDSL